MTMKAAPLSKKKEKSLSLLIVRSMIAAVSPFTARQKASPPGGITIGTILIDRLFGDIKIRSDAAKAQRKG